MYLPFTSLAELVNIGNEGNSLGKLPWIKNIKRFPVVFVCFGLFWQDTENDIHVKVLAIFESHLRARKKWPFAKYVCKRCWPNVTLMVTLQCAFLGLCSWLGYQRLPLTSFRHCIYTSFFGLYCFYPDKDMCSVFHSMASLWSAWWITVGGPRNKTCRISVMQGIS